MIKEKQRVLNRSLFEEYVIGWFHDLGDLPSSDTDEDLITIDVNCDIVYINMYSVSITFNDDEKQLASVSFKMERDLNCFKAFDIKIELYNCEVVYDIPIAEFLSDLRTFTNINGPEFKLISHEE